MNLLGVRRMFIEASGRYDLVNDPPVDDDAGCKSDNGADLYINAGQRILDTMQETPDTFRSKFLDTSAGTTDVTVTDNRTIEDIWRKDDSDTAKVRLTFMKMDEMREEYPEDEDELDQGAPSVYTVMSKYLPSAPRTQASDFTYDYQDIYFQPEAANKRVYFLPPADGVYTIEVFGKWFSDTLRNNEDTSWWTVNNWLALVQASSVAIEMLYRNSTGLQDAMNALGILLRGIDRDIVRQETVHTKRMKG